MTIKKYPNKKLKRRKKLEFIVEATRQHKNEDNFGLIWILKSIFISLLFIGVICYFVKTEETTQVVTTSVNTAMKKTGIRSRLMTLAGDKNILFLGVDANTGMSNPFWGTRSDTIIIISFDKNFKSVNLVSIPRDSKVYIPGHKNMDKINAAHAFGGPSLTVKTIEKMFGIDINNYVIVNYQGVRDFIDAIGGVPVNVEKRMRYTDRTAGLNINLYPGVQNLDAEAAEGYLRFRHDATGDIGRIKRQQYFVKALFDKLKSSETILKAPELMEIFGRNIRTDMNLFDLSKYITLARNLNLEDIKIATLPGKPSKYSPISYWILDAEKTQQIIDRLIYRDEPKEEEEELTVSLFYPPEIEENIDNISDKFLELGFNVKIRAQETNYHPQIIAHTKKAVFSRINDLKENIPELHNCQYIVEPDETLYPYTDFTIILSNKTPE